MEEKNKVRELLVDSSKKQLEAQGVLTRLFRKILFDLAISPLAWDRLMTRYLDNHPEQLPPRGKKRSNTRGNLNKELTEDRTMTWKVFLKALRFLGCSKVKFEVTITRGRKSTVHGVSMIIDEAEESEEDSKA